MRNIVAINKSSTDKYYRFSTTNSITVNNGGSAASIAIEGYERFKGCTAIVDQSNSNSGTGTDSYHWKHYSYKL